MKKVAICFLCIMIFIITLSNITCEEIFINIKDKLNKPTSIRPINNKIIPETKALKFNISSIKKVRVIIKNSTYTSIYHSKFNLKGHELKIYSGKKYNTQTTQKSIEINSNSKLFKHNNIIKIDSKNGIRWQNHQPENTIYKGMLYVYKTKSGLVVVNEVNMNDYIASVISSEIGTDSPREALMAQAVCARNFIMRCKKTKYKKYNAIADDSTDYQVYNRIKTNEKCKKAAKDTNNKVMVYKNKLVKAYYFSTSCGATTDYHIWDSKDEKYLHGNCDIKNIKIEQMKNNNMFNNIIKSTPSSCESKYPYYRWKAYITLDQLYYTIANETKENIGKIQSITITKRGTGGIVSQLLIKGTKGKIIITNQDSIRKALCSPYIKINLSNNKSVTGMNMLPSAFITLDYVKGKGYKIYGGGFGHGSGLSQNGAIEMAKSGKNYKEILKFYYWKVDIVTLS